MAHEETNWSIGVMEYWLEPPSHHPIFLNHSFASKQRSRVGVVTHGFKHFVCMLAKHRGRQLDGRRRAAHVDGVADELHLTHLRVFDFSGKPIGCDLRIGEYFVEG